MRLNDRWQVRLDTSGNVLYFIFIYSLLTFLLRRVIWLWNFSTMAVLAALRTGKKATCWLLLAMLLLQVGWGELYVNRVKGIVHVTAEQMWYEIQCLWPGEKGNRRRVTSESERKPHRLAFTSFPGCLCWWQRHSKFVGTFGNHDDNDIWHFKKRVGVIATAFEKTRIHLVNNRKLKQRRRQRQRKRQLKKYNFALLLLRDYSSSFNLYNVGEVSRN